MQLGVIGLGRMGSNIARRLHRAGHQCVVYNRTPKPVAELAAQGLTPASDIADLVKKLDPPRGVWIMLPAGEITEGMVNAVSDLLSAGDILIDGGNTFYKDDIRRAKALAPRSIAYIDVGTSGGVWGLERGYCLMIGGPKAAVDHLDPIFKALAPGLGNIARTTGRDGRDPRAEFGYIHAGPAGAGHFVKMIHNGIEYGLMQAYAEGFAILRGKADARVPEAERFTIDLADTAEVWRRGSVISSWLLDLCSMALAEDEALARFAGEVEDSGEGRWTVEAAVEEAVPANVLAASLFARFRSREAHDFGDKLLSAMRFKFGGHVERPAQGSPDKQGS
jgi:6-phosphogluconate dehydrogenase